MAGSRSLLRNRDFTVLWAGETVNALGSRVSSFAFPLVTYAATGSLVVAGWVEAAFLAGETAALLPSGVLADRLDRRRLMILISAAGAIAYASLAAALAWGQTSVIHLVAVALLTGVGTGAFAPAQSSAIRAVVSTEELPTALSQNSARESVADLVGGPLGGLLYSLSRWLPFVFDAITYAISCLTLSSLRADLSATREADDRAGFWRSLHEGLRFALRTAFFRVLMVWAALGNLLLNSMAFALFLSLVRDGVEPARIGLVQLAAGLGGLSGALVAPYLIDQVPTGRLTLAIAWSTAIPLLPLVWWRGPLAVGLCLFLVLLLSPAGNAGIGSYRVAITPAELQGRVSAASRFAALSLLPLAPVLGAFLLASLGAREAVVVLIAASAVAALIPTLSRSIRSVPRPREWAVP